MADINTNHQENRLQDIEARLRILEEQGTKLDRLVYKLFQRLPTSGQPRATKAGETA